MPRRPHRATGQPPSPPPRPPTGPKPETLDLGQRCLVLLDQGVRRADLYVRLHVSRKQIDYALQAIRRQLDGAAGEEGPAEKPRRQHRAVVHRQPDGPPPDWTWQQDAACKGQPVELFFGRDGERGEEREQREREAAEVCAGCPVRTDCLDYSISRPEKSGTWGGLDQDTRAHERRKRMRAASEQLRRENAA